MRKAWMKPAVLVAGVLLSGSVFASVDGYYADLGLGWAHASAESTDVVAQASDVDKDGVGFKFGMGYQANQNFAVEGQYVNFGHVKYKHNTTDASSGSVKTSVLAANIKGILPLADMFSANVKAGLFHGFVSRDAGMSFHSGDKPKNGWGVDYGVGVQYDINPYFGLGISWLQLLRDQNNSLLSVDLGYHFG